MLTPNTFADSAVFPRWFVPFSSVMTLCPFDLQVCSVLTSIIPDIANERQAQERYDEAQSTGKSLLTVVPQEHAEAIVEQLARCDPQMIVFAQCEEE